MVVAVGGDREASASVAGSVWALVGVSALLGGL